MHEFLYLAQTPVVATVDLEGLLLRFVLVSFALYLCGQALINIPLLQRFIERPPGQLIIFLLLLAASFFLLYQVPKLRVLHEIGLIQKKEALIWPDNVFSALALTRLSYLWPGIFDWIDRKSG